MVLRRLLSAFGTGVEVDTLLAEGAVRPGGTLSGEVRFSGGRHDHRVTGVNLEFVAEVDTERDGLAHKARYAFAKARVGGELTMAAGSTHSVPFGLPLPWETPLTSIGGHQQYGMRLGVATELELAGAWDKGDLDPLRVDPLPAHEAVFAALGRLGFTFAGAAVAAGGLPGSELSFHQELEYWSGGRHREAFRRLRLGFVAGEGAVGVHLGTDAGGGLASAGGPAARLSVPVGETGDLTGAVDDRLAGLAAGRGGR